MFGNRLKEMRDEKGISQRELAKLIQLSPSTVAMYELDQRSPDKDTIIKLSSLFNCTTDYLLGVSDHRNISKVNSSVEYLAKIKVPILGTIHAGLPILAEENYDGCLDVPESILADYVLRVVGDSMIGAGILDGDYAICRKMEEPQTGQIIVALKDEGSTSEATLKYYFNGNGNPQLKAANPTYPDINYKDGYRCAGNMVALIREDAPGYQTYRDYIMVAGHEEWTEVIEKATPAGMNQST